MHRRAYRMLPTVFPLSGTEDSFDGQEAEGALKNLLVPNLMGKQLRLTEKKDDIEETDTAEALAMVLEGHHDLSLIILDTGSRFRGGSENDAADTAKFVSLCEQYAEMTGATVLLVTHTNKQGGANQNVIRGSSALVDNARFAMTMEPNDDSNKVKFRVVKNNYGPVSGNVTFERCDDGQLKLVSETEATLEAALVNLGGKEQEIIDFVRQRADQNDPVTIRELCRTHKSLFDLSETKLVAGIEALISKVRLKDVKVGNRRELHPVVEVES